MADRLELPGLGRWAVDADAEDRKLREATAEASNEPHARPRGRLEQDEVGLCAFDPLTRPDRLVAEPHCKKLEQRPI